MAAFKAVQADLPERIVRMAEAALKAEIDGQQRAQDHTLKERLAGRAMGLGYGLTALATTLALAAIGEPWVAGVVGGSTALGVVAVIVKGRDS